MDKQPILSLCIPTNGAVEWILPVIESIYSQGYDNEKFEVVITDNGKDSQLPIHIEKMNYANLRYKQTSDEGFLNLVTCLKEGRGLFCKMINHRSLILPGSIDEMVSIVEKYKDTQPLLYFADGNAKIKGAFEECPNTDVFVRNLSYWCSWSAGIGFWQKDLRQMNDINLNPLFPNVSLLFGARDETQFVIWNQKYQKMEDDSGKGGYDLFNTFGVVFLDILNGFRMQNRISTDTFLQVKKELYVFLCDLYCHEVLLPSKHSFIIQDVAKDLNIYYGNLYYRKMVVMSYLKAPFYYIKYCIKHFIG